MGSLPGVPLRFIPTGVGDTLDGSNSAPGLCSSLQNLIPDPSTPGLFQCRPAVQSITQFIPFTSPGVISAGIQLGTRVYGVVASARNPGRDEPFVYDVASGVFVTVQNVTAANCPATQPTSGAWTPPDMEVVGSKIIICHPGFLGTGNTFGWFDISGLVNNLLTGTTASGNNTITAVSSNPIAAGISIGMLITGAGIPAGTRITGLTTTTIVMSANASASSSGVALTVTGGTTLSPLWVAGNHTTNPMPGVATTVSVFNNRAYFSYLNQLWFTDVLNPLNIAHATDFLIVGDAFNITATCSVGLLTTVGSIVQALLAFKENSIWQITGDSALSTLAQNVLSAAAGTLAPRSVWNIPNGIIFMADDGVRYVTLTGTVSDPLPDLRTPFMNTVNQSRVSAVFQLNTYRICVQRNDLLGQPYQDFWFDFEQQKWSGPHTFRHDLALHYDSTTLLFSNSVPRNLFTSDILVRPTSNYVESSVSLNYQYLTSPQNFGEDPGYLSIVETTVDLAFGLSQSAFTATLWGGFIWGTGIWGGSSSTILNPQVSAVALDSSGSVIAQASMTSSATSTLWGAFNWGGALWATDGGSLRPKKHLVPWNNPLVFDTLQVQFTGLSGRNVRFGSLRAPVEQLDYPTFT